MKPEGMSIERWDSNRMACNMAKIYVRKAIYPNDLVERGEVYWFWEIPFLGKFKSATRPARYQLVIDSFWRLLWRAEDEVEWDIGGEIFEQIEEHRGIYHMLLDDVSIELDSIDDDRKQQQIYFFLINRRLALEDMICHIDGIHARYTETYLDNRSEAAVIAISDMQELKYDGN
tara:strand:+ start:11589 stop:12110 length:522 start_codon:yes stop_codon:yes gene_type:complete